jgi:hypothetical protein
VTKDAPSRNGVRCPAHERAVAYWRAGYSVLPIKEDKHPDLPVGFTNLKEQPPLKTVEGWYREKPTRGIGIVCGPVSADLGVIDLEYPDFHADWTKLVEAEAPGLLDRLPKVKTPGKTEEGGFHYYYRNATKPPGTPGQTGQKLARLTPEEAERRTGDKNKTTAIEVKTSGYVVAPGSPAACHPSGRTYQPLAGPPIEDAPAITDEETAILFRCARALDRPVSVSETRERDRRREQLNARIGGGAGNRPGDVFNREGTWDQAFGGSGWKVHRTSGETTYWTRPGKDDGVSASTGYCASDLSGDLLYVFTSNAEPLQEGQCYNKFTVFALLQHGGDFSKAAAALRQFGYVPAKASSSSDSAATAKLAAYRVILDWFRDHYDPIFRQGVNIFSRALGRSITQREACLAPPAALIERLMQSPACPRDDSGEPKCSAVPKLFSTWSRSAWVDLLDSLPDEEDAAEIVEDAAGDFRRAVFACLNTEATFGDVIDRDGTRQTERRSLADWCQRWGTKDCWGQIRSKLLWVRRTDGRLRIALRAGLFAQQGVRELANITQKKFAALCQLYSIGVAQKACGERVVELTPGFVDELYVMPSSNDGETNGRMDEDDARACARA